MRAPLIQRPQRSVTHHTRERGVTMALVALAIVGILAMAALSIDVGTLYEASAEAQRAADAGALAAARTISMQGLTADPNNSASSWQLICDGETSPASLAAQTVAQQVLIGGAAASTIKVYYGTNAGVGTNENCSGFAGGAFGVNPVVQVYVQQAKLPTFFSRVFGLISGGSPSNSGVSATATAEVFNPSNSGAYSASESVVPIQPRCVKPWIVPNADPRHPATCTGTAANPCSQFVNPTTGQIQTPGPFASGGIIGERVFLQPDCSATGSTCNPLPNNPPQANPPALQYVPGQASFPVSVPIAIPTSGPTCGSVTSPYAQAIAGCDQTTVYQCGVAAGGGNGNYVDLSENPSYTGSADTQNGVQCLINQTSSSTANPSGQDILYPGGLPPPSYPFQIQAGSSSPLVTAGVTAGNEITSSASIVSLPIYDSYPGIPINGSGTTNVTIVGFLQVFINAVDPVNGMDVTVMNVSGCGNAVASGTQALFGTSPVPVRLITTPPPSN